MSVEEDHSDDIALAGEYVLHLLDDAERSAFETRLATEPALRELVREWDAQFVTLAEDIAPVAPPRAVKANLNATLFPEAAPATGRIWAWLSGGLVAATIIAGVVMFGPVLVPQDPAEPAFTARVAAEDGSLVLAASFIAETNTLDVSRETGSALPGRVLELWLIAEGADAPVSLGVLPEDRQARIDVPDALARQMAGAVLAISDEPPGGSPTGAPTGDVLAVGPVSDA